MVRKGDERSGLFVLSVRFGLVEADRCARSCGPFRGPDVSGAHLPLAGKELVRFKL
jgi:hypothetical protein